MKIVLSLSILANLILACNLASGLKHSAPIVIKTAETKPPKMVKPATTTTTDRVPIQGRPFQWHQLESANDYHAYVKNLRAAGCPERAVRAIVMADVNDTFFKMRSKLHLDGNEPGIWSGQNESRVIANLLGENAAATVGGTANGEAASDQMEKPTLPLAFQNVDLDALGLSEEEKISVLELRKQFVEAISPQNPSDPAYLKRWQEAQPEIDALLRDKIGGPTFQDYQSAAQNAKNTSNPAQ